MKHKPDYTALIQEYEKGGMKQKEFCSRNRIKYSTFQFWLSKIRKQKTNQNQFLPVIVIAQEVPMNFSVPAEICYPDGTVLKLYQVSAEMIRQFLPAFVL